MADLERDASTTAWQDLQAKAVASICEGRDNVQTNEDRTCKRCGKQFKAPCELRRHQNRKTSCAPIVDPAVALRQGSQVPTNQCRHCGRIFASRTSRWRHEKRNCKIKEPNDAKDPIIDCATDNGGTNLDGAANSPDQRIDRLEGLLLDILRIQGADTEDSDSDDAMDVLNQRMDRLEDLLLEIVRIQAANTAGALATKK